MLVGAGAAGGGVHPAHGRTRCHTVAGSASGTAEPIRRTSCQAGRLQRNGYSPSRALGQPNTCCWVLTVRGSPAAKALTAICHRRSERRCWSGPGRPVQVDPDHRRRGTRQRGAGCPPGTAGTPGACVLTVQGSPAAKPSTAICHRRSERRCWSVRATVQGPIRTNRPVDSGNERRMPPGTAGRPGACVLTVQGSPAAKPQQRSIVDPRNDDAGRSGAGRRGDHPGRRCGRRQLSRVYHPVHVRLRTSQDVSVRARR